jgi:predicted GNAT family acetyltransferase
MFRNEVGIDPIKVGAAAYRNRVLESIQSQKSFGWFADDGRTLFKLDIGAISQGVCQIQGVWLSHELRGNGLSASLVAAAVDIVKAEIAPTVCLYVNDFNLPAIRAYERVGFVPVGEFSTVFL